MASGSCRQLGQTIPDSASRVPRTPPLDLMSRQRVCEMRKGGERGGEEERLEMVGQVFEAGAEGAQPGCSGVSAGCFW